jgi:formate dehydrogenase iron-sulfur subunit
MPINRREFLKLAGAGLGSAAMLSSAIQASGMAIEAETSASMLYDATKCVGCRACQTACKKRSNLRKETDSQGLYEMPQDLSAYTWTMIKVYKTEDEMSFVKNQCMHCIDPACVSVCPVAALEKTDAGPVIYHADRCIGCRYCMAACPFGIPKSQWDKALPLIQKCDFCADRLANGEQPACGAACPTGALISGKRGEMLDVAHTRLVNNTSYVNHVYGETEAGGTSMLYIAGVSAKKLGFPELDDTALPTIDWPYMKAVPWIVGTMITLSTGIYMYTHRKSAEKPEKEA